MYLCSCNGKRPAEAAELLQPMLTLHCMPQHDTDQSRLRAQCKQDSLLVAASREELHVCAIQAARVSNRASGNPSTLLLARHQGRKVRANTSRAS